MTKHNLLVKIMDEEQNNQRRITGKIEDTKTLANLVRHYFCNKIWLANIKSCY